jgi:hypothetical protein
VSTSPPRRSDQIEAWISKLSSATKQGSSGRVGALASSPQLASTASLRPDRLQFNHQPGKVLSAFQPGGDLDLPNLLASVQQRQLRAAAASNADLSARFQTATGASLSQYPDAPKSLSGGAILVRLNFHRKMNRIRVKLAFSFAAALLSTNQAEAAMFSYQFSNVNGSTSGTVNGSISLPDGDGTFAAPTVTVDSYPASLNLGATPITILSPATFGNSFQVIGGQIVSFDYTGLINEFTALALNGSVCGSTTFLDLLNAVDCGYSGVLDSASTTLSFSPVAPTVPGPLPLLGTAAAFACGRRLRTRARGASTTKD